MLRVVRGNLVRAPVDAIVNAANSGCSTVAVWRAIAQAAPPPARVRRDRPCGDGVMRHFGGELSCRYVIHAVGLYRGHGDEDDLLAAAVRGRP